MKYSINSVLAHGFVMGKAKVEKNINYKSKSYKSEDEKILFLNAIEKSIDELNKMGDDSYLITQKLMISDPLLKNNGLKYIEDGKTASEAISSVMNDIIESLANASSNYLKERTNDIEDILHRLLSNLGNKKKKKSSEPYILYTDNLLPSYLINNKDLILGVIAKRGGFTSHSAILCRSFDIPYVIADIKCNDNDTICIDTRKNKIAVNPSLEDMERYIDEINMSKKYIKKAISHPGFLFLANISTTAEMAKAIEYDFDGIGLYRTEFIFMNTDRPLSFEEQLNTYSDITNAMGNKNTCFRTFDIGDDKKISYLNTNRKGIDNYKNNPVIFETQVKAILASNVNNNISIMFPMIETKDEFNYLKDWVIKLAKENNYLIPKIGMMLETKEALNNITDFRDTDFISLGTNDLTSELYHINREEMNKNINEYIDDLFDKIKPVVSFCDKNNIKLSVCGELAGVKDVALRFYKIGIKNLSVSPSLIQLLNLCYEEYIKGSHN